MWLKMRFRCDETPIFCGSAPYSKVWALPKEYGGVRKVTWPPAQPKLRLPFGLCISVLLWVGGFLLITGMAMSRAGDAPTCPSVEQVTKAAQNYDNHVRVTEVSKHENIANWAYAYANEVGFLPPADFALVLMFSRGGAVIVLGTRANGLCWMHPDQPPYEAVYQFFMSDA